MAHIKELLSGFIHVGPDNWKTKLLAQWDTIVGHLKTQVRLEKIYEDSLVLSVDDSSWMQELYCLSHVLMATINNNLDKPRITSLRFKNKGTSEKTPLPYTKKTMETPLLHKNRTLTVKEKAALEQIADEDLQRALKRFLIRCDAKGE